MDKSGNLIESKVIKSGFESSGETVETPRPEEMFYSDECRTTPISVKEDFKNNNFVLVIVNPKSGSHQGNTVLEHVKKYSLKEIQKYKVIKFPVDGKELPCPEPAKVEEDAIDKPTQEDEKNKKAKNTQNSFSAIIFNLISPDGDYKKGKLFIQGYLSDFPDSQKKLKILVAGGDGTVLSIVEDLNKEGIDLKKCVFGAMPFGTGNDLSNSLGFGNECKVSDIKNLQNVFQTYLNSTEGKIDIWELEVEVKNDGGAIFDVQGRKEEIKRDEHGEGIKKFKKTFVNYFSVGFDARVGFQFEKHRSSSRCCNKCVYCCEASKRIFCCKKNYGLTQLLDSFEEGEGEIKKEIKEPLIEEDDIKINRENEENINVIREKGDDNKLISNFDGIEEVNTDPNTKEIKNNEEEEGFNLLSCGKKVIFRSKTSGGNKTDVVLKDNPVNIICQNITFYMGGTQNIWDKSEHLGIKVDEQTKAQYKTYRKNVLDSFKKQKFDDKQIEFFTYEHGIEMGLERVARGLAKRVYQGPGPVHIKFKERPNETEKIALEKVYFNIDGEFYHLKNPIYIKMRLNVNLCGGQINILKNDLSL